MYTEAYVSSYTNMLINLSYKMHGLHESNVLEKQHNLLFVFE